MNSDPSPQYSSSSVAPSPRESMLSEWTDMRGDGLIRTFDKCPLAWTGWPRMINDGCVAFAEWLLTWIKAHLRLLRRSPYIN